MPKQNPKTYDLETGIEKISNLIKDKTLKIKNRPVMVGITGGSASGKSTLAERIQEIFEDEAMIFSMDGYFKGKDFMQSKEAKKKGIIYFDHPLTLDIDLFKKDFQKLKQGKTIKSPIYDMNVNVQKRIGYKKMRPKKIIIIEGIFALSNYLNLNFDIKAFVQTDLHGRMIRRLYRNLSRTGQKPFDIIKIFLEYVDPMHKKFIEPTKKNIDLIIENQYSAKTETKKFRYHKIQLKFKKKLSNAELIKKGAILIDETVQIDEYYMPHGFNLLKEKEKMKIRNEKNNYKFMYEGPRLVSDFKVSPVFEFEINKEIKNKFEKAYGKKNKTIIKKRKLFALGDIFFAMDEVFLKNKNNKKEKIGNFVEIYFNEQQKDDKIKLDNILNILGLDLEEHIMDSYFDLSKKYA